MNRKAGTPLAIGICRDNKVWPGLANHLKKDKLDDMKILRTLLATSAMGICLLAGRTVLADDATPPPVVVPPDRDDRDLNRDLKNAPDAVKTLILNFDATRDAYLVKQRDLLKQLRAATPDERAAIREQLQDNRAAFLALLKTFRQDLRKDLQDLKGKITHREFLRIVDAARDAARDNGGRHRGTAKP